MEILPEIKENRQELSLSVFLVWSDWILQHNVKEHCQKVEKGSQKNEHMEQLMEAEAVREVWLFQNVKNSADGIGDASCQQQTDGTGRHQAQRFPVEDDCPAHQQVKAGVQRAGSVHPAHLD